MFFLVAIVIPFIVETLQMIFSRSFDIDDLICNFIGIVIGFFVGNVIKNIKRIRPKIINQGLSLKRQNDKSNKSQK